MSDRRNLDPATYEHKHIVLKTRGNRRYHVIVQEPLSDKLGSNPPSLLLLHGFPDCWYGWRYQIRSCTFPTVLRLI